MEYGHAEALMPMVEEVMSGTGYDALDLLCVGIGPGAYTGLRIAISTARGLSLATSVPAMGIGSFDVHLRRSRRAGITGPLAVVLETRRQDVYLALFDDADAEVGAACVCALEDAVARIAARGTDTHLVGDAVDRFLAASGDRAHVAGAEQVDMDAAWLAEFGAARFAAEGAPDAPPRPLYLRAPDTAPPGADRQRLR